MTNLISGLLTDKFIKEVSLSKTDLSPLDDSVNISFKIHNPTNVNITRDKFGIGIGAKKNDADEDYSIVDLPIDLPPGSFYEGSFKWNLKKGELTPGEYVVVVVLAEKYSERLANQGGSDVFDISSVDFNFNDIDKEDMSDTLSEDVIEASKLNLDLEFQDRFYEKPDVLDITYTIENPTNVDFVDSEFEAYILYRLDDSDRDVLIHEIGAINLPAGKKIEKVFIWDGPCSKSCDVILLTALNELLAKEKFEILGEDAYSKVLKNVTKKLTVKPKEPIKDGLIKLNFLVKPEEDFKEKIETYELPYGSKFKVLLNLTSGFKRPFPADKYFYFLYVVGDKEDAKIIDKGALYLSPGKIMTQKYDLWITKQFGFKEGAIPYQVAVMFTEEDIETSQNAKILNALSILINVTES
ncbi:hypothetical protein ACFL0W_02415 [Nanoarchaeota archaeon]